MLTKIMNVKLVSNFVEDVSDLLKKNVTTVFLVMTLILKEIVSNSLEIFSLI